MTENHYPEIFTMERKHQNLLLIDGIVNLLLGVLLMLFPIGIAEFFGLPIPSTHFYATILGGVIFGIGLALGLEWWRGNGNLRGPGLAGAIAINLSGGGVLFYWLLSANLGIPLRGMILLWLVDILVLGIGLVELVSGAWKSS